MVTAINEASFFLLLYSFLLGSSFLPKSNVYFFAVAVFSSRIILVPRVVWALPWFDEDFTFAVLCRCFAAYFCACNFPVLKLEMLGLVPRYSSGDVLRCFITTN
jgi:hypothetical protein